MKRLLPLLVLLAVPALARHPAYVGTFAGAPTCDSTKNGVYISVTNATNAVTCDGGGTATAPCWCDGPNTTWEPFQDGAGSGSPGGANTQVQFNDSSSFGGDAGFTYNKATDLVTITGASSVLAVEDTDTFASVNVRNTVATPAADTELARVNFQGKDDGGTTTNYAQFSGFVTDDTDASEDGYLLASIAVAGSVTDVFKIDGSGVTATGTSDSLSIPVAAATDLFDMSAAAGSSGIGLYLPQAAECASAVDEGSICWDTDGDTLSIGDGLGAKVYPGASDISGDATMSDAGVVAVADDSHNHTTTSISGIVAADMGDADHGDVSWSSSVANLDADVVTQAEIADDAVQEEHLKAVDAAVDEECLTYESTTGDFEWQTCGGAEVNDLEGTAPAAILDTEILIGTGAGTAAFSTVSGDGSLSNAGALTIGDDSHNHTTTTISGVVAADMGDADHGDIAWSSSVASLDADVVNLSKLDDAGNTPLAGYVMVVDTGATNVDYLQFLGDSQVTDTLTASNYVLKAGDTMTGELVADDLGIEFTAGDTITDCSTFSATGGGIFFDDSEGIFKKCEDNVLTDMDTGGGGGVSASGTPANNQFAVWTDASTIEGISALTDDGTTIASTQPVSISGQTADGLTLSGTHDGTVTAYDIVLENSGEECGISTGTDGEEMGIGCKPNGGAGNAIFQIKIDGDDGSINSQMSATSYLIDGGGDAQTEPIFMPNNAQVLVGLGALADELTFHVGSLQQAFRFERSSRGMAAGDILANIQDATTRPTAPGGGTDGDLIFYAYSGGGDEEPEWISTAGQLWKPLQYSVGAHYTVPDELVLDVLGLEGQPTDAITDCTSFAATGGGLFYDDSEGVWKKCEDNVLTVMDTTGGTPATADISDVSVTQTELAELETIGATTISANQWTALGGIAETLTSTELNLLDGVTALASAAVVDVGDDGGVDNDLVEVACDVATGICTEPTAGKFLITFTGNIVEAFLDALDAPGDEEVLTWEATGSQFEWEADATGGTPGFDAITTGTNTTAAMTVGTGGSILASGSGSIDATTGDSATSFFDAGAIEAARGGTAIDTSGSTGIAQVSSGTWSVSTVPAGQYAAASIDGDDVNSNIAGAHLTLTAGSPDTLDVDAELKTVERCVTVEDPVTDEEWFTIWRAPTAVTITEIYCEVTGGTSVLFDFEVDDGTPTGVNGSDITCTTSGVTDGTLAGDTTLADTNRLDIDTGTVTGSVTQASFCFQYTIDD